jgi:hypothetical protein
MGVVIEISARCPYGSPLMTVTGVLLLGHWHL